jgi:2-amino-4-hydroxy-6-hydroxymethyldihydropteridine diphosphokinase
MTKTYISLGTNMGDKEKNLRDAVSMIQQRIGRVTSLSAFYVTEPWGFRSENSFLNAAVELESDMEPMEMLAATQRIERELGRTAKSKDGVYHDRIIDIDLLMVGDTLLSTPELTLPHPFMHERLFVMEPLAEIAPELVHPVLKQTMRNIMLNIREK